MLESRSSTSLPLPGLVGDLAADRSGEGVAVGVLGDVDATRLTDRVAQRDPAPGRGEVDFLLPALQLGRTEDGLGDAGDQVLEADGGVVVVRVGLVPLEHRELGVVLVGDPLVAEVLAELVDPVDAADDQALEVELGRDPQEEVAVKRVVMGGERARKGAAVERLEHRRLDSTKPWSSKWRRISEIARARFANSRGSPHWRSGRARGAGTGSRCPRGRGTVGRRPQALGEKLRSVDAQGELAARGSRRRCRRCRRCRRDRARAAPRRSPGRGGPRECSWIRPVASAGRGMRRRRGRAEPGCDRRCGTASVSPPAAALRGRRGPRRSPRARETCAGTGRCRPRGCARASRAARREDRTRCARCALALAHRDGEPNGTLRTRSW